MTNTWRDVCESFREAKDGIEIEEKPFLNEYEKEAFVAFFQDVFSFIIENDILKDEEITQEAFEEALARIASFGEEYFNTYDGD